PSPEAESAEMKAVQSYAEQVLGFPVIGGNEIELIDNYAEMFDRIVADIDQAEKSCQLCFYIWFTGGRAEDVFDALIRAAKRGVCCRALADGIGSKKFLKSERARELREAGIELTTALPVGLLRSFFVRRDLRNHRKLVLIDDRIAYTGSQNLVDPRYFKKEAGVGSWIDALVRVTGPATVALDAVFELDWMVETGDNCTLPELEEVPQTDHEKAPSQVVPSGPDREPQAIHQLLLTSLYAAEEEIVMTTPYFVPDAAILTALYSAARRGVRVNLIVPKQNDSFLVRYASVAHFDELLSAGVTISLFEGGLLHTKSLLIDNKLSIFGSVNLDMRSLWLNFEISLFIYDHAFAFQLHSLQQKYLASCETLHLNEWRERPAHQRFLEDTIRLTSPLL
ncbi:MAG: cardiolipin synthase, partial [Verrucomicrobiales bacterium]